MVVIFSLILISCVTKFILVGLSVAALQITSLILLLFFDSLIVHVFIQIRFTNFANTCIKTWSHPSSYSLSLLGFGCCFGIIKGAQSCLLQQTPFYLGLFLSKLSWFPTCWLTWTTVLNHIVNINSSWSSTLRQTRSYTCLVCEFSLHIF